MSASSQYSCYYCMYRRLYMTQQVCVHLVILLWIWVFEVLIEMSVWSDTFSCRSWSCHVESWCSGVMKTVFSLNFGSHHVHVASKSDRINDRISIHGTISYSQCTLVVLESYNYYPWRFKGMWSWTKQHRK